MGVFVKDVAMMDYKSIVELKKLSLNNLSAICFQLRFFPLLP